MTSTSTSTVPPAAPAPAPAPGPASGPPATQLSVRCLWAAMGAQTVGCASYVLYEHPSLVGPLGALGTLGAAVLAVAQLLRR
ncbi:hypothetical protein [Streptomyces sp. NPDC059783]|uniref:hypothetical protein n=1 Tax=Streptomyces sp. NPDC059783 TaxID=3346944 RepID=UPI00365040F0